METGCSCPWSAGTRGIVSSGVREVAVIRGFGVFGLGCLLHPERRLPGGVGVGGGVARPLLPRPAGADPAPGICVHVSFTLLLRKS